MMCRIKYWLPKSTIDLQEESPFGDYTWSINTLVHYRDANSPVNARPLKRTLPPSATDLPSHTTRRSPFRRTEPCDACISSPPAE